MKEKLDLLIGTNVLVMKHIGSGKVSIYHGGTLTRATVDDFYIIGQQFAGVGIRFTPDDVETIKRESKGSLIIWLKD